MLRRVEVSSAGQVLLDHHFYVHWPRHEKETVQWVGSDLISTFCFTRDLSIKICLEEQRL